MREVLNTVGMRELALAAHYEGEFLNSLIALAQTEDGTKLTNEALAGSDFWDVPDWMKRYRPYKVEAGILQVPILGSLLSNFPWQYGSYATGYTYIWEAVKRGIADPDVKKIALVINSGGGHVTECFDVVARISALRGQKPIRAFAFDHAYSAAYALASSADKIVVTKTGGVGSIGVITVHQDLSKLYEKLGVTNTIIAAGSHKGDGNNLQPLPKAVEKKWLERVEMLRGIFADTVASNRGMDVKDVLATEADTYSAEEAVKVGLADMIGPLEESMAAFAAEIATSEEEENMSTKNGGPASGENAENVSIDEHNKAVNAARSEGAKSERDRISAILALDEAKSRPATAMKTAMKTAMSAEEAKEFLADLPEESAPTASAPAKAGGAEGAKVEAKNEQDFNKAMKSHGAAQVPVGSDDDQADPDSADATVNLARQYGMGVRAKAK